MRSLTVYRQIAAAFCIATACLFSGCGGGEGAAPPKDVYPVKGKVLLANGSPLTRGKIYFVPKEGMGPAATGDIALDGTFSLKTGDGRDGAAAGDYKVRIEPDNAGIVHLKTGKIDPKSLPFPAKYSDPDGDTGLTATVKAAPTDLEPFKLVPTSTGGGDRPRPRITD